LVIVGGCGLATPSRSGRDQFPLRNTLAQQNRKEREPLRRAKLLAALALRALAIDADGDVDEELAKKVDATIDAAWHTLFDALAAEELMAEGYDPETARIGLIPAVEFSRFPAYPYRLESRVGSYRDVVVRREDVLRLWLRPPASVQDRPDPPETLPRLPKAGYWIDDEPLLHAMARLLESRECSSLWAAAQRVAPQARGYGTLESKLKRLHRPYREWSQNFSEAEPSETLGTNPMTGARSP
jgi:hypothetical protein